MRLIGISGKLGIKKLTPLKMPIKAEVQNPIHTIRQEKNDPV